MLGFISNLIGRKPAKNKSGKNYASQHSKSLKTLKGKAFRFEPLEQRQLLSLTLSLPTEISQLNTQMGERSSHLMTWRIDASEGDKFLPGDKVDIYWDKNGNNTFDPEDLYCKESTVPFPDPNSHPQDILSITDSIRPNIAWDGESIEGGNQRFFAIVTRGGTQLASISASVELTNIPHFVQVENLTTNPIAGVGITLLANDSSTQVYPPSSSDPPLNTYWYDHDPGLTIGATGGGTGGGHADPVIFNLLGKNIAPGSNDYFRGENYENGNLTILYRPSLLADFTAIARIKTPSYQAAINLYKVSTATGGCCGGSPTDPSNGDIGLGGNTWPGDGSGVGTNVTPSIGGSILDLIYTMNNTYTGVGTRWDPTDRNYRYIDSVEYVTGIDGQMQNSYAWTVPGNDHLVKSAIIPGMVDTTGLAAGHYIYGILSTATRHPDQEYDKTTTQSCQAWGAIDVLPAASDYGFGDGWSYRSLDRLILLPGNDLHRDIMLVTGDQRSIWFDDNGDQSFIAGQKYYDRPLGTSRTLVKLQDGRYKLTHNPDGLVRIFKSSGELDHLEDDFGDTVQSFAYGANGYLATATDRDGKQTIFEYADKTFNGSVTKNLLDKMKTPDGLGYSFDYEYSGGKFLVTSVKQHDQADQLNSQDWPTWSFAYDGNSMLSSSTGPESGTVQYRYDPQTGTVSKVYPTGAIQSLSVDLTPYIDNSSSGLYSSDYSMIWRGSGINGLGQIVKWTFDGQTFSVQQPSGSVTTYTRNNFGQLISKSIDPDGLGPMSAQITLYTYDTDGNLVYLKTPEGREEYWTYDSNHPSRLLDHTDQLNNKTTYDYTDFGTGSSYTIKTTTINNIPLPETERLSNANSAHFRYHSGDSTEYDYSALPSGTVLVSIDGVGNETDYYYDLRKIGGEPALSYGKLITEVTAYGTSAQASVQYIYTDLHGNPTAVPMAEIDALGRRTDYYYDALNRLIKTIGPYRVDGNGNPILHEEIVDNPQTATNWQSSTSGGYLGNYLTAAAANPATATNTWSFSGLTANKQYEVLLTWVADPQNTTAAPYSVSGGTLVTGTGQTANQQLTPSHSILGSRWQRLGIYTAGGTGTITVSLNNNANGRVVADAVRLVEVPASGAMEYQNRTDNEYDKLGRQTATIDAMGRRTETVYDPLTGEELKNIGPDPDGTGPQIAPVTVHGYDLAQQSAYTVDPAGRLSTSERDSQGRETKTYQGLLVDNGSPSGFQASGSWSTLAVKGYGGSSLYAAGVSGTATATATWTFSNLVADRSYKILVTWTQDGPGSSYATNAPFTISYIDVNGNPQQISVPVDQTANLFMADDPATLSVNELLTVGNDACLGKGWLTLNTAHIKGTQITVTLTNVANGRVAADAVAIYDTTPTSQTAYDGFGNAVKTTDALGNETYHSFDVLNRPTVDYTMAASIPDANAAYVSTGAGWTTVTPSGSTDTYRYHATNTGPDPVGTATWSSGSNLKKGEVYEILVSWQQDIVGGVSINSTNAPFAIYKNVASGNPLSSLLIDQTQTPDQSGTFYCIDGRYYRSLGRYSVDADTDSLLLQLRSNSGESGHVVVADDVRIINVTNASKTVHDGNGQVTASVDPLGRVSASMYDTQGRQTHAYQGQIVDDGDAGFSSTGELVLYRGIPATDGAIPVYGYDNDFRLILANQAAQWTFSNLAPNQNGEYYIYLATLTTDNLTVQGKTGSGAFVDLTVQTATDFNPLGAGWKGQRLVVSNFFGDTIRIISNSTDCRADAICLLQQTSETVYDAAGKVTKTTDALGHVTFYNYDAQNRPTSSERVMDIADNDGGPLVYAEPSGTWTNYSDGYQGNLRYTSSTASSTPSATAAWTFKNVPQGGEYEILATWAGGNASNVPYSVYNSSGVLLFATLVDQSTAPEAGQFRTIDGTNFRVLGTVKADGTTLIVKVGTDGQYVIADAVCLAQVQPKTTYDAAGQVTKTIDSLGKISMPVYDSLGRTTAIKQGVIVDDGDTAFTASGGNWTVTSGDSGYLGDYRTSDTTASVASWKFDVNTTGSGMIYDFYVFRGTRAPSNAVYQVFYRDTTTVLGTFTDNSTDATPLGDGWYKLGSITYSLYFIGCPFLTVKMADAQTHIADALCFVQTISKTDYDANGEALATYDARNNKTAYQYDNAGQLLKRTDPDADDNTSTTSDQPVTQTIYNAAGQTTAVITSYGQPANGTQYLYRTVTGSDFDYLGRQIDTKKGLAMDDKDAGFAKTGTTWTANTTSGYNGQSFSAPGVTGTATATATWTFNNLIPGRQYEIAVSYAADSGNTNNAPYSVSGGTLVGSLQNIDQTSTPTHTILGSGWQRRGVYQVNSTSTSIIVTLSNNVGSTAKVVADAVCLIEVTPAASSTYDAAGRVTASTDALGRVTTSEYDTLGRIVKVISPDADGSNTTLSDIPISKYVYDAAGEVIETHQGASGGTTADLVTAYEYDYLGRRVAVISPDKTTGLAQGSPRKTTSKYDLLGNLCHQYDALGNETEYVYDTFGQLTDKYDPDPTTGVAGTANSPHTSYTYDVEGHRVSLTDPASSASYPNTTVWSYDTLGRMVQETVYESPTAAFSSTFQYNAQGSVTKKIDRNGRETDYTYDKLGRQTSEYWVSGGSTTRTMSYTYDNFGRMLSASDHDAAGSTVIGADYAFTYDWYGNNTAISENIAGLTTLVNLTQQFDVAGNRLQLNAKLGSSPTTQQIFQNQYRYDNLNRMKQVSQGNQSGGGQDALFQGNSLSLSGDVEQAMDSLLGLDSSSADSLLFSPMSISGGGSGGTVGRYPTNKLVDFTYDAYGRMQTITRYNDFAKNLLVATTTNGYDAASRLTSIAHSLYGENTYNYSWTYDDADRVQTFTSPDSATAAGYNYDNGNQLKTADYDYQADESYNYDANGNRTSTGGIYQYQTGPQNRITQDTQGYAYTYDHEGNRKTKILANQTKVEYDWDNRDRLAEVRNYTWSGTAWVLQKTVDYTYDGFNRRVGKSTTAGGATTYEKYAYDGQNMVLQFGWPSSGGGGSGNALQHVMLYGPAVDQILADDGNPGNVVSGGALGGPGVSANVRWMLADNEGTIRDVTKRDGTANSVRVDHLVYDAFGNITSQTAPAEQPRFTYTAREFDADTGLYYYRARWYDAKTGKFISEDPTGFKAGDENLYRYCCNNPANKLDPSGKFSIVVDPPQYYGVGVMDPWNAWLSFEKSESGFWIQQVTVDYSVTLVDHQGNISYIGSTNDVYHPTTTDSKQHASYKYWEGAAVDKGNPYAAGELGNLGFTDKFALLFPKFDLRNYRCIVGSFLMWGEMKWKDDTDGTSNYAYPPIFEDMPSRKRPPAGSLYFSDKEPKLWREASVIGIRSVYTEWAYFFTLKLYDHIEWHACPRE